MHPQHACLRDGPYSPGKEDDAADEGDPDDGEPVLAVRVHHILNHQENDGVDGQPDQRSRAAATRLRVYGVPRAIPHLPVNEAPGSSRIKSFPVRNAFGGQVIGSTARLRRRRALGSVSPLKIIKYG